MNYSKIREILTVGIFFTKRRLNPYVHLGNNVCL